MTQLEADALAIIRRTVDTNAPAAELGGGLALIVEELRRLHESVLASYGLGPSE